MPSRSVVFSVIGAFVGVPDGLAVPVAVALGELVAVALGEVVVPGSGAVVAGVVVLDDGGGVWSAVDAGLRDVPCADGSPPSGPQALVAAATASA
ncbi:hypothetical protein, partial [Angustibacter peucedani]